MKLICKNRQHRQAKIIIMKIASYIFVLIFAFTTISCNQSVSDETNKKISQNKKTEIKVQVFKYDSLTIPNFFKTLIENHIDDFYKMDSSNINALFSSNDIASTDTQNINKYFTIKILHDLFTSQTASNCSQGEILNIPYLWHWTNPNPRHDIYFVQSRQLLFETQAPHDFSNYSSYADIDRTPYLFLSDLVHDGPKYYSNACDTFSTFGWCSEREMAFVALTNLLNFDGKVIAVGNHSWSEFIVPLKLKNGQFQNFKVKVDNTFNAVEWTTMDNTEIIAWRNYNGNFSLANWYNQKAKSSIELRKIKNHLASNSAMTSIEMKLVNYLEKKINKQ